jgi:hypothetical protein
MADDQTPSDEADHDKESRSNIPGTVGALVNATNSKPFTALLGPTFTALGSYWGELTEEKVAGWREKRVKNAQEHVRRVREKIKVLPPPSDEKTARLTAEWEIGAETVDPNEVELSALWEGLLGRVISGDDSVTEMMSALSRLTQNDAKVLLNLSTITNSNSSAIFFKERREIVDRISISKLEKLGLIKKFSYSDVFSNKFIYITIIVPIIIFANLAIVSDLSKVSDLFKYSSINPIGILIGMVSLAVLYFFVVATGAYRPTPLGEQLIVSGRRFQAAEKAGSSSDGEMHSTAH